jgi:hypothetical protein
MVEKLSGKSRNYVFSYDPMSRADAEVLRGAREVVKRFNREVATTGLRYRLSQSARGPRAEHSWKYDNKHKPRLRIEDAARVDVYVALCEEARLVRRHGSRRSASQ